MFGHWKVLGSAGVLRDLRNNPYLTPFKIRPPLIFGRGWPKIRGDQKVQVFGWPKIKGDEVNSKPFENASLAHESYFHYMEIQKWWLAFSLVHSNSPSFCATFQGMRSDLINRTVLSAVLLMYNAVIETCEIPYFVRKEKNGKGNFVRGGRKLKGTNWGRVAENSWDRKIVGPKINGTEN